MEQSRIIFASSPRSWQAVQAADDVDQLGQEGSLVSYGVGRFMIVCFFVACISTRTREGGPLPWHQ